MRRSPFRQLYNVWLGLPVRHRGAVVVAIPAACLLITFGAWIWSRQTSFIAQQETEHTQQVLSESDELLRRLTDAEASIRGYILTDNPEFLEPYEQTLATLPETRMRLDVLLRDMPEQYQTYQEINQLVAQRMRLLEALLEEVNAENLRGREFSSNSEAEQLIYQSKSVMDQVRTRIEDFQAEERNVLNEYLQQRRQQQGQTTLVLWFTFVISLLGSLAAVYLFSSLDRELQTREMLLRESKSLLQAIVSNVVDGVITLDSQGKIEVFNPAAAKMFGYMPHEVAGKELDLLLEDAVMLAPSDSEDDGQHWRHKWQTKGLRKVGTPFPIEISVSDLQLDNRQIAIIRDISEFQQAEAKLQARADELVRLTAVLAQTNATLENRNQELEQFAYVASHDLKAPLRAIANLSAWMEEDLENLLPEENKHQMQLLRGRVMRMEALINGLLEYSRVGRTQVAIEPVSVQELLDEILDSLAPPPSFTIAIDPGMPTLTTRRMLLRQVFANLIGNAIKHHDRADGHITLSVQDLGEAYEFAVADDGPGISPAYHHKIFAIFQTLEARDTKESTGIGLSIVKKIIELEGGTIRVESQEGKGATFYFTWLKHPVSVRYDGA